MVTTRGATLVTSTMEEMTEMEGTEKTAGSDNREKLGIMIEASIHGKESSKGENTGRLLAQNNSCNKLITYNQGNTSVPDNTEKGVDPNEIIVTDAKRRIVENEYGPELKDNPDLDMCSSPLENDDMNQKNLQLAGAALQARHSS